MNICFSLSFATNRLDLAVLVDEKVKTRKIEIKHWSDNLTCRWSHLCSTRFATLWHVPSHGGRLRTRAFRSGTGTRTFRSGTRSRTFRSRTGALSAPDGRSVPTTGASSSCYTDVFTPKDRYFAAHGALAEDTSPQLQGCVLGVVLTSVPTHWSWR